MVGPSRIELSVLSRSNSPCNGAISSAEDLITSARPIRVYRKRFEVRILEFVLVPPEM